MDRGQKEIGGVQHAKECTVPWDRQGNGIGGVSSHLPILSLIGTHKPRGNALDATSLLEMVRKRGTTPCIWVLAPLPPAVDILNGCLVYILRGYVGWVWFDGVGVARYVLLL